MIIQFIIFSLIKIILILVSVAYYTAAERKIMGAIHRRRGPNVVGVWGLVQPIADGVKLVLKQLPIPSHTVRVIFLAAPVIVFVFALIVWSVIPGQDYAVAIVPFLFEPVASKGSARQYLALLFIYLFQGVVLGVAFWFCSSALIIEVKSGGELPVTLTIIVLFFISLLMAYLGVRLKGVFKALWRLTTVWYSSTYLASGYHLALKIKFFQYWNGTCFTDVVYENKWLRVRAIADTQDCIKAATDRIAQLVKENLIDSSVDVVALKIKLVTTMKLRGMAAANNVKLISTAPVSSPKPESFFMWIVDYVNNSPVLLLTSSVAAGVLAGTIAPHILRYCKSLIGNVAPVAPEVLPPAGAGLAAADLFFDEDFPVAPPDEYAIARADYLRRWPQDENAPS